MKDPVVKIIHFLPGRLRLRLSVPPRNVNRLIREVKEHEGINEIKYNQITRSLLIFYEPTAIKHYEILIRVCVSLSMEHNMQEVVLENQNNKSGMTIQEQYCGILLLVAAIAKTSKLSSDYIKLIDYGASFTTLFFVINHALKEMETSGSPDPEVLSSVYLINAMAKGNFLLAATITWLATFARHFAETKNDSLRVKAYKVYSHEEKDVYYDVVIRNENLSGGLQGFLRIVTNNLCKLAGIGNQCKSKLFENVKKVSDSHGNRLEGLSEKANCIFLRLEN